jgi:hypothetical protein
MAAAGSTAPAAAGTQRWGSSSVSPGLCSEPSESNLSVAAGEHAVRASLWSWHGGAHACVLNGYMHACPPFAAVSIAMQASMDLPPLTAQVALLL